MIATDYRARIAGALRDYMTRQTDPPTPRLRISSAALVDGLCAHCGSLESAAIRRGCRSCPADHVAILCCACTTSATWGDHLDHLTDSDKAALREVAHRVGQAKGAA